MADKAAAAATSPRSDGDNFEARRTSRVAKDFAKADGDVWQENLAVCEAVGNKLLIRSYYLNKRTGKRVWDEPPSGASKLLPATQEMRRMANIQMQEMQLVLGVFPEDTKNDRKKSGGGLFRWKGKSGSGGATKTSNNRITYKPGSALAPKPEIVRDDTMDPDIQKAISMSLGGTYEHPSSSSEPKIRAEIWQEEEDDAVAMARALSLSAAEANGSPAAAALSNGKMASIDRYSPQREETEEEILARVLEQSRIEAEAKSSEEEKHEEDAGLHGLAAAPHHVGHNIASNDSSRSPNSKSLSPNRQDGRKQSLSPKRDDRKPSSLSPNRGDRKPSASQRRSSRNDLPDTEKVLETSRRKSSASPKIASSMKKASIAAAAAEVASEEEQMLQLALEASLRDSDRIAQAQSRITEVSQRGRRTISNDHQEDESDRVSQLQDRIAEASQRGVRSISDHEASLESHRVSQLQDRLSQRGRRTISPMRDSNHSFHSVRNSDRTSSEHRRRSVHEVNHSSPKQPDWHSSEHKRRSVHETMQNTNPDWSSSSHKHDGYSSEHRRRSVDEILHATTSESSSTSSMHDRTSSEHRRRIVEELRKFPNFSSPKREISEHRSHSMREINPSLRHGDRGAHSPRASRSPKGSSNHEATYSSSARGVRSSYHTGIARKDMPSLITNSSSGDGICKSGSSEKTVSSEKAIKGIRSNESLRNMEEVPTNGHR